MYEKISIRSHRGVYSVGFDAISNDELFQQVNSDVHYIVDSQVADLHKEKLGPILRAKSVMLLDATEENKSLEKFPAYIAALLDNGIKRGHRLCGIGGGIVQDVTCFISATLMRGLDWYFVPTTLLAQADSCIGSKSSINSSGIKNILGTFTPPRRVLIDKDFLLTLSEQDVLSGIGEMIKVHIIDSPDSFSAIEADYAGILERGALMDKYIKRSLEIKKRYIEVDEFDTTVRNIFNYGHSFGHAIESATHFSVPHGIAVSIGMDMANFVSQGLGLCEHSAFARLHGLLQRNYQLFADHKIPVNKFFDAISKDKKNTAVDNLTLILLDRDANVAKTSIENDLTFRRLCESFLSSGRTQ